MNPLGPILADLRERKLLPVVALLIVAIVAVPVALSKTSSTSPPPPSAPIAAGVPSAASIPPVSLRPAVMPTKLVALPHDPFNQGATARATSASTGVALPAKGVAASVSTPSGAGKPTGRNTVSAGVAGQTQTVTKTSSTTTTSHVVTPPTLTDQEAYTLAVGLTSGNGVTTMSDLERLDPLPSSKRPLLLPLGVLQGGHRVLFAVLPGTTVSGPGACVPGPVDCEVLILAPNQLENLRQQTSGGSVAVTQFAVTDLSVARFATAGEATRVRGRVSALGQRLLAFANLPASALFPYDARVGALLDRRSLSTGGS